MLQQGQNPAISFYPLLPSKPDLTSSGLSFPLTSIFQQCFVFIDSSFQPQSPDLASAGFLLGLLPESPAELRMWFCQSNCGLLLKGVVRPVPPTVCPVSLVSWVRELNLYSSFSFSSALWIRSSWGKMNTNAKSHSQGWKGQWNRERRDHLFQQHLIINISFIINWISSCKLLSLPLCASFSPLSPSS